MSLVEFHNVTLGYEGVPVVRGLDFSIEKGQYICVIGENGSGKSTMLKALLGFVAPMSGTIVRDRSIKNAIGYLPQQQPSQADFPASVFEVVLSGCQGRKKFFSFYNAKDKKLAEENIEKMHVSYLKDRSFRELSGGQKQRVLLARAMCAASDLMLLDEPVAGLDEAAARGLYETIAELNAEGMTVIMITHDAGRVLPDATHVLKLGQSMQFFGTAKEYLEKEKEEAGEERHDAGI